MIKKEIVYKKCSHCDSTLGIESPEVYGCDCCGNTIDHEGLRVAIFNHREDDRVDDQKYCSWKCLVKGIRDIKCDGWIMLPHIDYEKNAPEGCGIEAFLKELKG